MTPSLICGFLWLILANLVAMFPTQDRHRSSAFVLVFAGIPLLGWITWTAGPFWGMAFLAAGASVLRWPLIWLWRRLRGLG